MAFALPEAGGGDLILYDTSLLPWNTLDQTVTQNVFGNSYDTTDASAKRFEALNPKANIPSIHLPDVAGAVKSAAGNAMWGIVLVIVGLLGLTLLFRR